MCNRLITLEDSKIEFDEKRKFRSSLSIKKGGKNFYDEFDENFFMFGKYFPTTIGEAMKGLTSMFLFDLFVGMNFIGKQSSLTRYLNQLNQY